MEITQNTGDRLNFVFLTAIFSFIMLVFPHSLIAQEANLEQMKAKAAELVKQSNLVDALPILEKVVKADAKDADMQFYLGFALMGKSVNTKDKAVRQQLRVRARDAFVKSKELGNTETIVDALIQSLPPDGSEPQGSAENDEAKNAMDEGEQAFSAGKIDEALIHYQKAFKLNPQIYEAALYSGDMYFQKNDYPNAEIWYQKAIAIDPNRETAYRYSASPLMKQKKITEARNRYIEAFITEPYSNFAQSGLTQWGEATNTRLSHPRIDIPEYKVGADGKTNSTIKIDPSINDGSMAWISYTATRNLWREKKFAAAFPAEKTYRHTLQEEADALRSVIAMSKELKDKTKTLNPQIAVLTKLDQDGLLEAYILMARPDDGIVRDHPAYLKQNRDKLRQYVVKYVVGDY